MGWEPQQTTAHEYDGDRLVRSHVTTESEWDDEQRSLLLALQLYEDDLGPHGIPMSEALNEDNVWAVDTPTDFAAKAVEVTKERLRQEYPDDPKHGMFYVPRKL